jgi:NAD+ kinase
LSKFHDRLIGMVWSFDMTSKFTTVGIFGKTNDPQTRICVTQLINYLQVQRIKTYIETETLSHLIELQDESPIEKDNLSKVCDLVIVVGGDGSLLNAARAVVDGNTPILGIHRGRLGFLTDISPAQMETTLNDVFNGKYKVDNRSLLKVNVDSQSEHYQCALNDIVIYNGDIARLIEFEIFIDDNYVLHQRSDGLIISTPTGSTAYALSGGGPIVYPTLPNILIVPMFPHTLSARPLVIHENSKISVVLSKENSSDARISCDGQVHFTVSPGDEIVISGYDKQIQLIHPDSYNYYSVLREKLGWNLNSSSDRYPSKSSS